MVDNKKENVVGGINIYPTSNSYKYTHAYLRTLHNYDEEAPHCKG